MKYLGREAFGLAPDLPRKDVEIPELNGAATVRRLTAAERSQYQSALVRFEGETRHIVFEFADLRLAALTLIDRETGARLYPDMEDGVQQLGKHDSAVIDRIVEAARALNPLSKQEVEEAVADLKETENSDSSSP